MSVAIRTATRIQDQDDAPSLGAGQNGYALTWNNATSAFVATALPAAGVTDHGALTGLGDDDHSQYLLATGARTGASSQAQTFTNGIIGPSWKPASDSTTALQLQYSWGGSLLNADTVDGKIGIGGVAPGWMDTRLYVLKSVSTTVYNSCAASFNYSISNSAPITSYGNGIDTSVAINDSGNAVTGEVTGGQFIVTNYNSAKVDGINGGKFVAWYGDDTAGSSNFARAGYFQVFVQDSTVTNVYGTYTEVTVDTGTVTNVYGHYLPTTTLGAGAITNNYGIYVNSVTVGSNKYAIFTNAGNVIFNAAADANSKVGIGTTAPATVLHAVSTTATTNALRNVLTLGANVTDTGVGAAGLGAGLLFTLESSTTAAQDAARIQALWYEATHASRKADLVLTAYDTAEREGLRIRGAGSGPAIGFYGVSPIERAVLATGAGASVDDVITALQNLGLVKQS